MKLDTDARVAKLSTKEEVRLRRPRCWPRAPTCGGCASTGAELEGIHYLRALGNADAIRADAEEAERVVLVGGSYIACEVAASLTALGKRCTMVMLEDAPLVDALRAARRARSSPACCASTGVELVHRRRALERASRATASACERVSDRVGPLASTPTSS